MTPTAIFGWVLLSMCANSDNNEALAERLRTDNEMQQLVEYLRTHKNEVSDMIFAYFYGDKELPEHIYRRRNSDENWQSQTDLKSEDWYFDTCVEKK